MSGIDSEQILNESEGRLWPNIGRVDKSAFAAITGEFEILMSQSLLNNYVIGSEPKLFNPPFNPGWRDKPRQLINPEVEGLKKVANRT